MSTPDKVVEALLGDEDPKDFIAGTEGLYEIARKRSHTLRDGDEVLATYFRNISNDAAKRFMLGEDDVSELRRMLMTAWQYDNTGSKSTEIAELIRAVQESGLDPKAFIDDSSGLN